MSQILDALKRALNLTQSRDTPVQAEALLKSFGFRKASKQSGIRRVLVYLLPAVLIGLAIAAGVNFFLTHRSRPAQAVTAPPTVTPAPLPVALPNEPAVAEAPAQAPLPQLNAAAQAAPPPLVAEMPKPARQAAPRTNASSPKPKVPAVANGSFVAQTSTAPSSPAAPVTTAPPPLAAETAANDKIAIEPSSADPWKLGIVHYEIGEYSQALQDFKRVLQKDPLNARAMNNLGLTYLALSNGPDAIQSFRTAIAIEPEYDTAHNNLGNALMNERRYAEAEVEFRNAIKLNSKSTEALINLGRLAKTSGSPEQAKVYYIQALGINSASPEAHYNLAAIYEEQKEYGSALEHYRAFLNVASQQYASMIPQVAAKVQALTPR